MATIFMTGFELGYRPSWITGGSFREGYIDGTCLFSRYSVSSASVWFHQINGWPNPREFYLRMIVRGNQPTNANMRWDLRDQNGALIIKADEHGGDISDRDGVIYDGPHGSWISTGGTQVEVYVLMGNPGQCIMRIDEVQIFDLPGNFAADDDAYLGSLYIWAGGIIDAVRLEVDDLCINDTTGGHNNSWPGRAHTYGIRPNSQGVFEEWGAYPGIGESNYEDINEVGEPDTDDYVQATAGSQIDTYGFETVLGTVVRASLVPYTRMSLPGTMKMEPVALYDWGLTLGRPEIHSPADTYESPMFIFDRAPDGSIWTTQKFYNTEFGYRSSGS